MKNYIKPTFMLAGLAPVALASGGCSAKMSDENILTLVEQMVGDINNAFAETENCEEGIPTDLLNYCKFTAVEEGSLKILGS